MSIEEERRSLIERKRNIFYLIGQYLEDYGMNNTYMMLMKEANLQNQYQVCDNIDLDSIYLDYCSYYQLKFGKQPKILKKIDPNNLNVQSNGGNNNNNRKTSARTKRNNFVAKDVDNTFQIVNTTNHNGENLISPSLKSSLIVLPFVSNKQQQDSNQNNDNCNQLTDDRFCVTSSGAGDNFKNYFTLRPLRECEHFTPEWKELAECVCRDIVRKDFCTKWKQICGHENVKSILFDGVLMPLKYPELFTGVAKPWKGILLYGPPGSGKTLIAKALCTETQDNVTFFNVVSSTIISKWRGESEKFIRTLFELAKFYAPSIIFIDEIDGLTSKRDTSTDHEASRRFKNEFLIQIDSLDDEYSPRILLLANTNLPWEIDQAFLRRFERKILVDLPNSNDRVKIILEFLPIATNWDSSVLDELAQLSEGFTGDDLRIACKEASMKQIRSAINLTKNSNDKKLPNVLSVTIEDVKNALKQIQPVAHSLIEKYQEWANQFGNQK